MCNKKFSVIICITCFIGAIILALINITFSSNSSINRLIKESINNFLIAIIVLIITINLKKEKIGFKKDKKSIWLILPFLVSIVNFPFYSLFSGTAKIIHYYYIPLHILNCFFIGIIEEFLFRIFINDYISKKFSKDKSFLVFLIISSAIFSLSHFLNLLGGAGFLSTLLQVGYTFLLGAMFTIIFDKTKNIWFCVIIHAIFDFGGNIITYLGEGVPQDLTFWIITILVGISCAIEMVFYVLKKQQIKVEK